MFITRKEDFKIFNDVINFLSQSNMQLAHCHLLLPMDYW